MESWHITGIRMIIPEMDFRQMRAIIVNLQDFLHKIRGKSGAELAKKAVSKILRIDIITYLIMTADLTSADIPTVGHVDIRPMTMEDADMLETGYFSARDHALKKDALTQQNPLFEGYVCENREKEMVGYCWIMKKGSEYEIFRISHAEAYVAELYINMNYRRQGLAAEMLKAVCRELQCQGIRELTLAVNQTNAAAIRCYEKCGFEYRTQYIVCRMRNKVFPYYSL